MDRPKSVVRVAETVHVSHVFIGSSSGMDGIRYLRVFDYVSVSECATGPARASEVYPERPQMEKKPTHLSLPYDYCLATQHP